MRGDGHFRLLGHESLVEHPLVSCVLVNEIQPLWPLGDDIGLSNLSQHSQGRKFGRLRKLKSRRRLNPGRFRLGAHFDQPAPPLHVRCGPVLSLAEGPLRGEARHAGDRRLINQGAAHRLLDGSEDRVAVQESDLALSRVDVDVNLRGGQPQAQNDDRVAARGQQGMVGFAHGITEHAILHPAAVDEEGQVAAVGSMQGGRADVAVYVYWFQVRCSGFQAVS